MKKLVFDYNLITWDDKYENALYNGEEINDSWMEYHGILDELSEDENGVIVSNDIIYIKPHHTLHDVLSHFDDAKELYVGSLIGRSEKVRDFTFYIEPDFAKKFKFSAETLDEDQVLKTRLFWSMFDVYYAKDHDYEEELKERLKVFEQLKRKYYELSTNN